jgi:hypothetical protein
VKAPVLDFFFSNRSLEHFNSMENSIQARIDSYKLPPEWQDPAKLYTTIKALRNIEEPSTAQDPVSQYFLVMNSASQQLFDRHEEEAELVLGFAVARLLLAEKYRIVGPEFKSRPQLYHLKGKSPSRIPVRFTSSAPAAVTRATLSQVTDEIERIPFENKLNSQIVKSIGTIGRGISPRSMKGIDSSNSCGVTVHSNISLARSRRLPAKPYLEALRLRAKDWELT